MVPFQYSYIVFALLLFNELVDQPKGPILMTQHQSYAHTAGTGFTKSAVRHSGTSNEEDAVPGLRPASFSGGKMHRWSTVQ